MARKSKKNAVQEELFTVSAPITDQKITDTVEKNYMPYAMTVIVSRAIPEIDGFKPSQRKILYTMYKMGLLTGQKTKSANIVGQTMKLNPHGDASIYETMVRLTRGNEALLHPFIDSKGSFGKQYSDMAYAASRYTEAKLDTFCSEIFSGIDKDAVDFAPNYDNTMKEPVLLPTTFPNILVSPNKGIAVGLSSNICSFNLAEICDGTVEILKNPDITEEELMEVIKAPDFAGGGYLLYDREKLLQIYKTGHGSVRLRARYVYDKSQNCIEIIQIPYSTSLEAIMKKLTALVKEGKLREVTDFRDEIGLSGFKLTIDIRNGTDPDALMRKLFRQTPLQDDFPCNFNVLIDGYPVQTGIIGILKEWIRFRMSCVKRELSFDLKKKQERMHLLVALAKILLDIDKAIRIVRDTKNDKDVIPNLMEGFSIDEIQAEYIAEIKLRNLNKEYILNRVKEIEDLQKEIEDLADLLKSESRLKKYIAKQLMEIKKKHGIPRKTQLIYEDVTEEVESTEPVVDDYKVRLVLSREGYLKKITMKSLQGSDEYKFKEGDALRAMEDSDNRKKLIFFSDKAQCYKSTVNDFECCKASALGEFVAAKLKFGVGEKCIFGKSLDQYLEKHNFIFFFANGKAVKVPATSFETKSARKKLTGAYSQTSPIVAILYEEKPFEVTMVSDAKTAITINTALIPVNPTRTSKGVTIFELKKGFVLSEVFVSAECPYDKPSDYRRIKVPAKGIKLSELDIKKQQTTLLD